MADINITLDAQEAQRRGEKLKRLLDEIEAKAKKVQKISIAAAQTTDFSKRAMMERKILQDQRAAAKTTAERKFLEDRISRLSDERLQRSARERRMDKQALADKMEQANVESRGARSLITWKQRQLAIDKAITAEKMEQAALEQRGLRTAPIRTIQEAKAVKQIAGEKELLEKIAKLDQGIASRKMRGASDRDLQIQKYQLEEQLRDIKSERTAYDVIGDVTREQTEGKLRKVSGEVIASAEKETKRVDDLTAAMQRENLTKKEQTKINKLLATSSENQDRIARQVGLSTGNLEQRYKKLTKEQALLRQQFIDGEISGRNFSTRMKDVNKRLKAIDKESKNVTRSAGLMGSAFGKITRFLVAISAGMFILQKLQQYFLAIIRVGSEYSDILTKIQAETYLSRSETEDFADSLKEMSEGTVFKVKDIYEAYKELRNQGLGYQEALSKSVITSKIARNEQLKVADAAKIAAYDVHGLTEYYQRYNDIASQTTASDAWGILKKDVREVIEKLYRAGEPAFVGAIEALKPAAVVLVSAIAGIAVAFAAVLSPVVAILGALKEMADVIRVMPDLKFWGTGRESLESQLERATDAFLKALDKTHKTAAKKYAEAYSDFPEAELGLPTEVPKTVEKTTDLMTKLKIAAEGTNPKLRKLAVTVMDILKLLNKPVPSLADKLDPKVILKAHQEVYQKLGVTTKYFFDEQTRAIRVTTGVIEQTDSQWAKLIKEVNEYNQEQAKLKPQMTALKSVFDAIGRTTDEYWKNREEQIKKEIYFMIETKKVTEEYGKALERVLMARLEVEKRAPRVAAAETTFEESGIMPEYLAQERERQARVALGKRMRLIGPGGDAAEMAAAIAAYNEKIIKINEDRIAKVLEKEREGFEATGRATKTFETLQLKQYDLMAERLAKVFDIPKEEVAKRLKEWQIAFSEELIQPSMEKYSMMYSELHIMDQKYYNAQIALAKHAADKMGELTEDRVSTQKYYERMIEGIEISRLRTGGAMEGIKAGMLEIARDNETVANKVADAWIQGASNIEQAWKSGFFDVMEMNFDSLEDAALNFLKSIQRAAIEILYQTTMYGPSGIITQFKEGASNVVSKMGKDISAGIDWGYEAEQAKEYSAITEGQTQVMNQLAAAKMHVPDLGPIMLNESQILRSQIPSIELAAAAWRDLAAAKSMTGGFGGLGGGAAAGAKAISIPGQGMAIQNPSGVIFGMQHGGIITEPIAGIGLHTGRGYTLGEAGPEYVTPAGKMGPGQRPNFKVVMQNNTGVEAQAEQGEVRWDGEAWVMNVVMNAYVNNKYGYRNMMRGR